MKGLYGLVVVLGVSAGAVCAQDVEIPEMPEAPPAVSVPRNAPRVLIVGPRDAEVARKVSGQTRLVAAMPSSVKPAEVEFFVDGKSAGKTTAKPFRLDLDTGKLAAGEHLVKAVARDESGSEVWSASSKANVVVAGDEAQPEMAVVDPVPVPDEAAVEGTEPEGETANGAEGRGPESALDKVYVNRDYGISVKYPSAWSVKEEKELAAHRKGCLFWVVFGEDPLRINVHAQKLAPGTDADKFAKYNTYVKTWTRKKVWSRPAFATTSGSAADRTVVHRLIIMENGRALMMNCVDKTGRPASESAEFFERVVNGMQPLTPVRK